MAEIETVSVVCQSWHSLLHYDGCPGVSDARNPPLRPGLVVACIRFPDSDNGIGPLGLRSLGKP